MRRHHEKYFKRCGVTFVSGRPRLPPYEPQTPDLEKLVSETFGALLRFFSSLWNEHEDLDMELAELHEIGWQHGLVATGAPDRMVVPVLVAVDLESATLVKSPFGPWVELDARYLERLAEAQRPWLKRRRRRTRSVTNAHSNRTEEAS